MIRFNVLLRGLVLSCALISLMLAGCTKDNELVSTPIDNLEVSTMSSGGITDFGLNSIILDSVKILLKDIKLNVSSSSDSTNFKTGPFVMRLNPNSTVNGITTALIPAGSYDKVQFEIHKIEDSEYLGLDTAFSYNGGRYSVVVYGKYNGELFIYRSTKSAKQKLSFSPAVTISVLTRSNITLKVQPYTWFWNGADYIDPRVSSNENDIDNNIKASFKAFKDDNKDGIADPS